MKTISSKDALLVSSEDDGFNSSSIKHKLVDKENAAKFESSEPLPTTTSHNIAKDFHNILFLMFLYLLQGKIKLVEESFFNYVNYFYV